MLKGSVISPFSIAWKTTRRQLATLDVVMKAFATDALSGTWVIATVAFVEILFFLAFHNPAPMLFPPLSSLSHPAGRKD
jgi:hypothetical protein